MVVNDSMLENQDSGPAAVSPETEPDAADRVGEGGGVQDAVDQLQDGHLPGSLKSYLGDKGIEINGETVRPVDDGEGRRWAVGDEGMEILADKENSMLVVLTRTSLWTALFFGFCAAMLGISGFESSANFVEEQEPGVFPKTLRNMWWAVSILNPTMALLTLAVLPVAEVGFHKDHLLAHLGDVTAGGWLKILISIDAALVLSGAVLTSYVGVTGLVRRMTLDRCLPQFLLKENRAFGTTDRIIIAFFILAVSVLAVTGGELEALAGVYTLSFLAVMVLFAVGNMLLKIKRHRLPRPARAPWPYVIVATIAAVAALIGIAVDHPDYFVVFLSYFFPTLGVVLVMLWRVGLLAFVLGVLEHCTKWILGSLGGMQESLEAKIDEINSQQVVFFTRGDNVDNLRRVVEYVRDNENTNKIKVVTVVEDVSEVPEKLERDLAVLDEAYPKIDLELVKWEGTFSPALIDRFSKKWGIPKNLMFIGSHGDSFKYDQASLGGVRLII